MFKKLCFISLEKISQLDRYRFKGNEGVLQLAVEFFEYTLKYCPELKKFGVIRR